MTKLLCVGVLLLATIPACATCVVRICDLAYAPQPPNPITVAGRVTSEAPLVLTDGRGALTVTGITAQNGDFLVVEGDYDGNVLVVSQGADKATLLPASVVMEMVYVPAGPFQMGNNGDEAYSYPDELPLHEVNLPAYWMGRSEVTRGQYRCFMDAGGYSNPAYWSAEGWAWRVNKGRTTPDYWADVQTWGGHTFTQSESHPVVGVTYPEAAAFCTWAGVRLPSEAEWEKAARAGGTQPYTYPWGYAWNIEACNHWYDSNAAGGGLASYQTAPVGSYPAGDSRFGCQDMSGNVWECVADWYGSLQGSSRASG